LQRLQLCALRSGGAFNLMSSDPVTNVFAALLAALGIGGGGVYRVTHKQRELETRINRLDEDRKAVEKRIEKGRQQLETTARTVIRLDTKVDALIDLVKEKK